MRIEKCAFGSITIDGKTYRSDLVIYPDGTIQDNWWRKSSHILSKDDIGSLINKTPDVIVVGTGINGLMRPEKGLAEYLMERGIELVCAPNQEAINILDRLLSDPRKRIGVCFHLTC
ncbi:MAG: hypothetical protein DRG39_05700 [Deltaproteobacteria bacterium]|nr:MAG: hypothetical protein DRG39_05700 [Deltaproteobacteria bacterium]